MALFKILTGTDGNLSSSEKTKYLHPGYAYFAPNTGYFYIDVGNDNTSATTTPVVGLNTGDGAGANRIKIAAGWADQLRKSLTFSNGTSFNGSANLSVDYNSVGAAASGHTHTTNVESTSDSAAITLGFGSKYKITAGGTSKIIAMPSLGTGSTQAAYGNHTHGTLTIQGAGTAAIAYQPAASNDSKTLNIVAGTNMSVAAESGKITITGNYPVADYDSLGIVKPAYSWGSTAVTLSTSAGNITTTSVTIANRGTTAGRYYGIEVDKNGVLFVNVPWVNTWTALSTTAAGYVAKAPNDTSQFLRGDGNWSALPLTLSPQATGFKISGGTSSVTLTVGASYTLAAACAKGVDTSITDGTSSTNLPTSKAVSDYVGALDFTSIGVAATTGNKFVCQISQSNGKISAAISSATIGSATSPVWVDTGVIKAGDTYAGGTKVTLNGSDKGKSTASFYAPTSAGTANQICVSTGGAPGWKATANGAAYATESNGALTFGTLPIAQGGTGTATAPTQWGIIYASTTTTYASTSAGTTGYLLQSNATSAPSWIQATDSATAFTIVKRDSNKGFSAGTITATRLIATSTTDATGSTGAAVALITGTATGKHLEFDIDEIQAKTTDTTTNSLSLNYDGGNVLLGSQASDQYVSVRFTSGATSKTTGALRVAGGVGVSGDVYASTFVGPLTGNVTGNVTGALTGNADTATQFSSNATISLTGDVTGSNSSKKGWSIATTLANSGVTAGSYGPSANATPGFGSTFNVPYVTVDAKGRVTAASTKTITVPSLGTSSTTAAAGNHTHSIYVLRAGDSSITGDLNASKAGGIAMTVSNTNSGNNKVGIYASTNMGLYSWAYTNATTSTSYSAGWIVYRAYDGGYAASSFQLRSAVWNDYAEFRTANENIQPGYVVIDTDNGTMFKTSKRLMPGAQIVSDTFGFAIGETEESKTPIAVSGRVLAYTYRSREEYHAGMAVCSAPNGTVDIMTREEIMMYPDAIIGIVSEIPSYDIWHAGSKEDPHEIQVDKRIWIKVR